MRYVTCGLAIALALKLSADITADADNEKEWQDVVAARKEVLDLASEAEAGKDITKKAVALRKKYKDLAIVMHVYKPRPRSFALNVPLEAGRMESKLLNLSKQVLSPEQMKKET